MAVKKLKKIILQKEHTEKYLEYLDFCNKFINHAKKHRQPFIEKDMRL